MWGRGAFCKRVPSSLPPKTFDLIESLLPVFQDYLLI